MKKVDYEGYRFPPAIIQQAVWLYFRFTLSFRDVEDLLAERGITVSYETVRRWVNHFGPMIAADLRKRRPKPYATWHFDEVYLKISGRMVYLWRAVDDEGEVLDLQSSTGTMSAQRGIEDKALSTMMPTSNIFKDDNFECVERGDTIGIT
jgi:putative transposase